MLLVLKTEFTNDSWITRVEYDTETQMMLIFVKGNKNLYECPNVPNEVYEGFKNAISRGKYFNEFIKGKYVNEMFKP